MIRCYLWKPQFRVQRRQSNKATKQILNLNTKTIESKHFIRYLKRFPLTLSFCIVMPTSKLNYQCFLILVQSFRACTFSRIVDCFQCKLWSVWSYIFLLNGPDKEPKQNNIHSNKKPGVFANEPPSANETFFGALSQGRCTDWLVCIAYCLFWHLIGSDGLSFFFC